MAKNEHLSHDGWVAWRWRSLKAILDNRVVASTAVWIFLIPVLVSVTRQFPVLQIELPFNLFLIYFSALSFFLARMIYNIWCPDFLRRYSSPAEAIADGVSAQVVKQYVDIYVTRFEHRDLNPITGESLALSRVLDGLLGPNSLVKNRWKDRSSVDLQALVAEAYISDTEAAGTYSYFKPKMHDEPGVDLRPTNVLIWWFLELQDVSSERVRFVTSALICIGLSMLAFPIAQGFVSVVRAAADGW